MTRSIKSTTGRTNSSADCVLNRAFADLRGAAFALSHPGALNGTGLIPQLQRIHQVYAQLDALAHSTPIDLADDQRQPEMSQRPDTHSPRAAPPRTAVLASPGGGTGRR